MRDYKKYLKSVPLPTDHAAVAGELREVEAELSCRRNYDHPAAGGKDSTRRAGERGWRAEHEEQFTGNSHKNTPPPSRSKNAPAVRYYTASKLPACFFE